MRQRLVVVFLVSSALIPRAAFGALGSPHDRNAAQVACYYCHSLTIPVAGAYDYTQQCLSCHTGSGGAFGFPWTSADEAVPGTRGNSHAWSKAIVSPAHGSANNLGVSDQAYLVGGRLQCVVCHNAHATDVAVNSDSMHPSIPPGIGKTKTATFNTTDATGSASLFLTVAPGTPGAGYRVRITAITVDGGSFILSREYGSLPDSWLNWSGTAWVPGSAAGQGHTFRHGADASFNEPLDLPGVFIRFTSGARVGDYWDFYVGYPFLRQTNVDDAACFLCHKERVMNHVRARGNDRAYLPDGVRKFSHPVGVGLNANGYASDRTRVLDADGTVVTDVEGKVGTSTSDGADALANATNDLVLTGGIVRCTTCHRVHNADSNSFTRDAR